MRPIVLAAAATVVFVWTLGSAWTPAPSDAAERAPAVGPADEASLLAPADAQVGDQAAADGDDRVSVQLWTLVAAVGAAGVGLLLLLLRMAMGWVKPPPPQEESHH